MQRRQAGPHLHRPSAPASPPCGATAPGVWLPFGPLSSTDWNMPPVIPDNTEHKADKEERDNQKSTSSPLLQEQALLIVYSAQISSTLVECWRSEPIFTVSLVPGQRRLPTDRDTS